MQLKKRKGQRTLWHILRLGKGGGAGSEGSEVLGEERSLGALHKRGLAWTPLSPWAEQPGGSKAPGERAKSDVPGGRGRASRARKMNKLWPHTNLDDPHVHIYGGKEARLKRTQ